jgi:alpha-tubulin suppressor-like RCC1 family protein
MNESPLQVGNHPCRDVRDLYDAIEKHPDAGVAALRDGSMPRWVRERLGNHDLAGELSGLVGLTHADATLLAFTARVRLDPTRALSTFGGEDLRWEAITALAMSAAQGDERSLERLARLRSTGTLEAYAAAQPRDDYHEGVRGWLQALRALATPLASVPEDARRTDTLPRLQAALLACACDPTTAEEYLTRAERSVSTLPTSHGGRCWWYRNLVQVDTIPIVKAVLLASFAAEAEQRGEALWRHGLQRWQSGTMLRFAEATRSLIDRILTPSAASFGPRGEVAGRYFRSLPPPACPATGEHLTPLEVRRAAIEAVGVLTVALLEREHAGEDVAFAAMPDIVRAVSPAGPGSGDFDAWVVATQAHWRTLLASIPTPEERAADPLARDAFVVRMRRVLEIGVGVVSDAIRSDHGFGRAVEAEVATCRKAIQMPSEAEDASAAAWTALDQVTRSFTSAEEERVWRDAASVGVETTAQVNAWDSPLEAFVRGDERSELTLPSLVTYGVTSVAAGRSATARVPRGGVIVGIDAAQAASAVMIGRDLAAAWFVVDANGRITSWGSNRRGLLGRGERVSDPVGVVEGVTNVIAVAGGIDHVLALTRDGSVFAWGCNTFGQLGVGDHEDRHRATRVRANATVREVGAGQGFSVALDDQGRVWTWGNDAFGTLGRGRVQRDAQPERIRSLPPITAIAAGTDHVLAIDRSGRVWGWGLDAAPAERAERLQRRPKVIPGVAPAIACAAGARHSVALHANGRITEWGDVGDADDALTHPQGNAFTTHANPSGSAFVRVQCGLQHTIAIDADGVAWGWGANHVGQLPVAAITVREPTRIPSVGRVEWIASGPNASFLLDRGLASTH